ncbi:hypothetical protein DENSPDRAFT_756420, partial [Dentipellis sp. KUC8613]
LPLPPGPKRKPVIGNLLDMPKDHEVASMLMMRTRYGMADSDILHVDVFGTYIVIVNSAKIANELFEKRSLLYSDSVTLTQHCSLKLEWVLGVVPYGQKWRDVRKAFHEHYHPTATLQY